MTENSWLDRCPRVRSDLLVSAAALRGSRCTHLIKDPQASRAFEIGEKEHFVVARLDGRTSLRAIGDDYARHFGRRVDTNGWTQILGQLRARSLLVGNPAEAPPPAQVGTDFAAQGARRRRPAVLGGELSFPGDAAMLVERIHHAIRRALSPWFVVPLAALLVTMEIVLAASFGELLDPLAEAMHDPVILVLLMFTLWGSAAVHELAHGVVARRFGGNVTAFGVRWRFPLLYMYCRVDNYLFLRRRWHQVATKLAGSYANLVVLVPFFVAWLAWRAPDGVTAYLTGVLVFGSLLGLINLLPIPPLDGYAALNQALGVSGLAPESRAFTAVVARRLTGRRTGAAAYPRWAQVTYLLYAVGSTGLTLALSAAVVFAGTVILPESWGGWKFAFPIVLIVSTFAGLAAAQQMRRGAGQPS